MKTKKEKGDIGLTASISEFTKEGYHVSLPIAEHLKYDMVIEKNNNLARVQCRYTTAKENLMRVKLRSVWSNRKGVHKIKRNHNDYDILSVYCPNTNQCYFLADQEFEAQTALELNLKEEHHSEKTRTAKDYISCDRAFAIWISAKEQMCGKITENKKPLTDLLDKETILELKKTMTNQQIGILYGVSHIAVSNLIARYGIGEEVNRILSSRKRQFDKKDLVRGKVLELNERKISQRDIAKGVGCSRYFISRIIDEEKYKNGVVAEPSLKRLIANEPSLTRGPWVRIPPVPPP